MEILIRISRDTEVVVAMSAAAIVTRTTLISRRTWHRHRGRQLRACSWSTKCICATHLPREWTRNHIACIHLKLFYHKVWKIWVNSKFPDRPMIVNWCLYSFRFCFQIPIFDRDVSKISIVQIVRITTFCSFSQNWLKVYRQRNVLLIQPDDVRDLWLISYR